MAQKRLAEKNGDTFLMARGIDLERQALEAIKLGLSELPHQPQTETVSPMKFVDWDHRPAVLLSGDKAFAVLGRGEAWKSVDASDVGHTGADLSEADWRKRFEGEFGALDLSKIPDHSGDKSAWPQAVGAITARQRAHLAEAALPGVPNIDVPPIVP